MTAVPPVLEARLRGRSCSPALALLAGGSAQGADAAKLRVLDASPVRLAGSGFSPGERVRVRVRAGLAKRSRRVRANADGRFRVRFAELAQDPCRCVAARDRDGLRRPPRQRQARAAPVPARIPTRAGSDRRAGAEARPRAPPPTRAPHGRARVPAVALTIRSC